MKLIVLTLMALIGTAGCATAPRAAAPAKHPASEASSFMLDRCADRLQEICGEMLEYYAIHRQLPATIEELQALAAQDGEPAYLFVCPVSHQRYIYNPEGIALPGMSPPARVVLYDAEPVHEGHRWGVAVSIPVGNHPLIAKVVRLPDGLIETATSNTAH